MGEDPGQAHLRDRANARIRLTLPRIKQLVELHGGQLRVTSRPGVGTKVTFTLPVYDATLHADRQTGLPGPAPASDSLAHKATCVLAAGSDHSRPTQFCVRAASVKLQHDAISL